MLATRCANLGLPLNTYTEHAENQGSGQRSPVLTAQSVEMKYPKSAFGVAAE
jgi:hypothetical protein